MESSKTRLEIRKIISESTELRDQINIKIQKEEELNKSAKKIADCFIKGIREVIYENS